MRKGFGFRALVLGMLLWAASAGAQTSLIDPSVLGQLSQEEREQLLRGLGGSGAEQQQDQYLQQPQVVQPETGPYDAYDPYAEEPYAGDYYSGGYQDGDGDRDGRYYYPAYYGEQTASPRPDADAGLYQDRPGNPSGLSDSPLSAGQAGPTGRASGALGQPQDRMRQRPYPDPRTVLPGIRSNAELGDTGYQPQISAAGRRSPRIRPFGYDLFRGVPNTFAPATDIPVPADYVVGPGDNVRVQLFGNQNQTFTLLVSRDGTINFPKLGPIVAAGLRFDELQAMLEERAAKEMIGTTASVTLGRLRSMRVFVLGDVNRPGSYTVSSLSTMTHALFVSGGVSSVGSLRRVMLKRNGDTIETLDLYRFLLSGDSSSDLRLQPGDVVFVPPAAARVTVEGEIKRPAIYELAGERTLADMLALAGGKLASSDQTYVQVERIENSTRKVLEFDLSKQADLASPIRDGDVVRVRKVARQLDNEVRVTGYVKHAGVYPWTAEQDLRSVLGLAGVLDSDARSEVYLPLGIIERTNRTTGIREFHSFNVAAVLNGEGSPVALQPNDLVIVFGREDIDFLSSFDVEAILSGKPVAMRDCAGLVELKGIVNSQRAVRFLKTLASESVRLEKSVRPRVRCPEIFRETPRALPYLLDKGVGVYGEAVRPGLYPVSDDTSLKLLLQAAGGTTSESDPKNVEYVSYLDALNNGHSRYQVLDLLQADAGTRSVAAGDILNLRPIYLDQEAGSVRVMGEVRFPGTYGIVRGETLSQVIKRAGGTSDNAYPYGAVFTRESARKAEEASFKRAALDLQEAMVTVVTSGVLGGEATSAAQFMEGVVRRLNSADATGRVVIQADPAVLQVRPELDVAMEPGDALFIPKRPSSVAVAGQVLSPGSLAFSPGASAKYYIERAGGLGQAADAKRAFVVLPDGSARQLKLSAWNFQKQDIPPGSLVVVPRNAAPLNGLVLSERILSIFSDLALSAAALVTISNDN